MKAIEFYTVAEKTPANGQKIWYVYFSRFYGTQEFRFGIVEFEWEVRDANGYPTGGTYFEDPTHVLADGETADFYVCVDGQRLEPETYWTTPEACDMMLPSDW